MEYFFEFMSERIFLQVTLNSYIFHFFVGNIYRSLISCLSSQYHILGSIYTSTSTLELRIFESSMRIYVQNLHSRQSLALSTTPQSPLLSSSQCIITPIISTFSIKPKPVSSLGAPIHRINLCSSWPRPN